MHIDTGIVLPEQPDRHIVFAQCQYPDRFALANGMFSDTADYVLPEIAVLLRPMIGDSTLLKDLRVHRVQVQSYALTDGDRRAECQAVEVSQSLRLDFQPVTKMTERFERLHLKIETKYYSPKVQ